MITATRADDLKYVGVPAFHPAVRDADRPAPQARSPAMARLASTRRRHRGLGIPRVTGIARAGSCRDGTAAGSRPRTGDSVRVCRASHRITSARPAGPGHVQPGSQPQMLRICRQARLQRVRPADPLQPRRDLGVFPIGMITAGTADDLVHAGVAGLAFLRHPDQLPPQARCPARAGLASKGQRHHILGVHEHPRVPVITLFARCGDRAQTSARPGTGHDVRISCTAHSTHPRVSRSCLCRGLEQRCRRSSRYPPSPAQQRTQLSRAGIREATTRDFFSHFPWDGPGYPAVLLPVSRPLHGLPLTDTTGACIGKRNDHAYRSVDHGIRQDFGKIHDAKTKTNALTEH